MWKARCRLLEWIGLVLLAAAPSFGQGLYLHVIPVTASAGAAERSDAPWRLTLDPGVGSSFPPGVLKALGGAVVEGKLIFTLASYPQLAGPVGDDHRRSTFIIDFEEDEVRELAGRLAEEHGAEVSLDELRDFADRAIPHKTLGRGWDVASRVARHREGDCTEHAALLTALARSIGRAARVVVGIALVLREGSIEAFGHAWAEVHDGESWLRVDATGIDREAKVRYVPLIVVDNEGPGFVLHLMERLLAIWPARIEVDLLTAE